MFLIVYFSRIYSGLRINSTRNPWRNSSKYFEKCSCCNLCKKSRCYPSKTIIRRTPSRIPWTILEGVFGEISHGFTNGSLKDYLQEFFKESLVVSPNESLKKFTNILRVQFPGESLQKLSIKCIEQLPIKCLDEFRQESLRKTSNESFDKFPHNI